LIDWERPSAGSGSSTMTIEISRYSRDVPTRRP
jgi:hypothetical protein